MIATPTEPLTLHEAASLLGVHYMTAYRYVRLGVLPARKSGGVWHVERSDLDAFRHEAERSTGDGRRRPAPWAERLEQRLLAGDSRGAWGVIESALAAGDDVDDVYLDVLAPAMVSIGARWERGEIDVALEHQASVIAMRLVGRLGHRFVRRGRTRGVVIVGAAEGERHGLPVAMVADLVRQAGWEVFDLGADTPSSSFAHAASSSPDLVAVGVSITTGANLAAGAAAFAAVRAVTDPEIRLFAGGAAVRDQAHARELGADEYAPDGRALAELLDGLATS